MGKRARAQRKIQRLMAKRAKKNALKALYESYRNSGQNKKSKRFRLANKRSSKNLKEKMSLLVPVLLKGVVQMALRRVHAGPKCGNVGCIRCSEAAKAAVYGQAN